MTFDITSEVLIDDIWIDNTSDVYWRDGVVLSSRGVSSESQRFHIATETAQYTVNNRSGKYTPQNPRGIWHRKLAENSPTRVSVVLGDSYLWTERRPEGSTVAHGSATTPDAVALDITGDIDIRCEVDVLAWSSNSVTLANKYATASNQRSWQFRVESTGSLGFVWSTDGTFAGIRSRISTSPWKWWSAKWARVTLDVDNGASQHVATFYTSMDGVTWDQLGTPITTAGTTSIFSSSSPLWVGGRANISGHDAAQAHWHSFELRSGIAGTVVANPDFNQAVGATSFNDGTGKPWTIDTTFGAKITKRRYRFCHEIASFQIKRDTSGNDRYAVIETGSIFRRINSNNLPSKSAYYRELTSSERPLPLAYWPCEDDEGSTTIASALAGHPPMTISGTPDLASNTNIFASDSLPVMNSAGFRGTVLSYTPATNNKTIVRMLVRVPEAFSTTRSLCLLVATGTAAKWTVAMNTSGSIELRAADSDDTNILSSGFPVLNLVGKSFELKIELTQNGANIDWQIGHRELNDDGTSTAAEDTGTLAGRTIGIFRTLWVGHNRDLTAVTFGHISVANDISVYTNTQRALEAWSGERSGERIKRLLEEEGILFVGIGDMADTELIGQQRANTLITLLSESMETDGGFLYSTKYECGITYRNRKSLYNTGSALTIDYFLGEVADEFVPNPDDLLVHNDITVNRKNGSSYRLAKESGPLSVQAPPNGRGTYNERVDLSLEQDDQLRDQTGYRLHLGTFDDIRYPRIAYDIAREVDLKNNTADAVLMLDSDPGHHIILSNLPTDVTSDAAHQLLAGYNERFDQKSWTVTINGLPDVYHILTLDEPNSDRVASDGMQIAAMPFMGTANTTGTVTTIKIPDAEAINFAVNDRIQLSDDDGLLRISDDVLAPVSEFQITAKSSLAGTTTLTFSPALVSATIVGDKIFRADETSLSVIRGIFEGFEKAAYDFETEAAGNLPWRRSLVTPHSGVWCLRSGAITHSQTSDFEVTIPKKIQQVRFWYRTSSESTFDFFRFLINGVQQFQASGETAWTQSAVYAVTPGQVLTFRYIKDTSVSAGEDAVYIDDLEFRGDYPLASTAAGTYSPAVVIEIGGEKINLTAVSGVGSTQTFTVSRRQNGFSKALMPGTPVRLWDRHYLGL
ncbi:MAG: hypothetical protein ACREQA_19735 [Candidatus Binatia bacterium]